MKKLSCRRLAMIGASALIFQSSFLYAATKVYTSDADFDMGVMDGVEHSTTPNQLQLSVQGSTLPFIWIANSGENTVSKMNTETGCELGRYRTGPGGENPSRTTVDINGDLWVGNRDSATATKIALTPTDTNGDGTITTSQDTNGNCLIEPDEVLAWGTDEAVLLRIDVDPGPRALAIDADNNVWIGGTGGHTMRLYNGTTGALIKEIPVGVSGCCYGALVDSNGTLWISNDGSGSLTRIDDPAGTHTMTFIPSGDGWVYGMSIDREGFIYTAGWSNNRLRKLDPATNTWVYSVSISGGRSGRGVSVGLDGDVWVAQSGTNKITRHNAADGSLIATITVGSTPTGVATAEDGKIWVTNYSSNSVMRVDPATNAVDFTQEGHTRPYNYSDMTGIISRSITTRSGTWTVVYQEASLNKATVSWTADTPSDSTITVMAESSVDGVTWSTAQQIQSGVEFNTVANATRIRLVVEFNASTGELQSPILYDLTVDTSAPTGPGTLQFSSTNYSVNENGGTVTITVTRVGGSSGAISANYTSSDGTATVGSDYTQTTGTLNWDDGDNSAKTFTVPIIDDGNSEGPETFTLSLSDPVSGENLDNATVTIEDNDTTLVSLFKFTATALETEILLEWQTGDESDNAGFRIWRATGEGWKSGDYSTVTLFGQVLNDKLIPANGLISADGGSGASYSYRDDNVESGLTYYYLLEDVDNFGVSTYHFNAIDSATP